MVPGYGIVFCDSPMMKLSGEFRRACLKAGRCPAARGAPRPPCRHALPGTPEIFTEGTGVSRRPATRARRQASDSIHSPSGRISAAVFGDRQNGSGGIGPSRAVPRTRASMPTTPVVRFAADTRGETRHPESPCAVRRRYGSAGWLQRRVPRYDPYCAPETYAVHRRIRIGIRASAPYRQAWWRYRCPNSSRGIVESPRTNHG